jgi:hypothetical protein
MSPQFLPLIGRIVDQFPKILFDFGRRSFVLAASGLALMPHDNIQLVVALPRPLLSLTMDICCFNRCFGSDELAARTP